jgi:hypothetical protein
MMTIGFPLKGFAVKTHFRPPPLNRAENRASLNYQHGHTEDWHLASSNLSFRMHVLLLFKDLGVQEVLQVLWISQTIAFSRTPIFNLLIRASQHNAPSYRTAHISKGGSRNTQIQSPQWHTIAMLKVFSQLNTQCFKVRILLKPYGAARTNAVQERTI